MPKKIISWAEIKKLFPSYAEKYKNEFSQLFKQLGKKELTSEDIEKVMSTQHNSEVSKDSYSVNDVTRTAGYVSYFYDNVGMIIGRIEVDDNGDSKAYDKAGQFVGMTFEGKTLNEKGDLVAYSDILSSLLVKEERVVAHTMREAIDDIPERPLTPPEGKYEQEEIEKEIRDNVFDYADEYIKKHQSERLFLYDLFIETGLYPEYMEWVHKNLTPEQIQKEEYVEDKFFLEFYQQNESDVALWLLNDYPPFIRWAEDKVLGKWGVEAAKKQAKIVKKEDGYHVLSEGGKNLGGPYTSREKAEERLRQVEYFKHKGSFKMADLDYYSVPLGEWEGEELTQQEKDKKYYTPVQKGKFKLYDTVLTPKGKGRIVRKQTTEKPYFYTVKIGPEEEIEIFEEKQLEKVPTKQEKEVREVLEKEVRKEPEEEEFIIEKESLRIDKDHPERIEFDEITKPDYFSLSMEDLSETTDPETRKQEELYRKRRLREKEKEKKILQEHREKHKPKEPKQEVKPEVKEPVEEEFIITREESKKKARETNDSRFSSQAVVYSWLDFDDLEFDKKIKALKADTKLSLEQKIEEAKHRASELAWEQVYDLVRDSNVTVEDEIYDLDPDFDRINWIALFEPEEEEEETEASRTYSMDQAHTSSRPRVMFSAKVGWLRDRWLEKANKIMETVSEVSDDFAREREQGTGAGVNLFEYYNSARYEDVEKPLRENSVTKVQAEKLLGDLLYQFKTELYSIYGVTSTKPRPDEFQPETPHEEKKEEEPKEKESSSLDKEFPSTTYRIEDIYPPKGTGAGMPSGSDITRLVNEQPVRVPRSN